MVNNTQYQVVSLGRSSSRFVILALLAFTLLGGMAHQAKAQVNLGLRFGYPTGLDATFGTGNNQELNLALGGFWGGRDRDGSRDLYGYNFMVAYHWKRNLRPVGLKWYYGLAGVVSRSNYRYGRRDYQDDFTGFAVGIPLGLEYSFDGAPIQLFAEIIPGIDINYGGLFTGGGLGIRLMLDKL